MASTYATDGCLGVGFTTRTSTPTHKLGHTVTGDDNELWIYCLSSGTVATGTCTVNASTYVLTDTAGNYTADAAFADAEYGWVRQTAKRTL